MNMKSMDASGGPVVSHVIVMLLSHDAITGAGDPRCKIGIVMGVTNPDADRY